MCISLIIIAIILMAIIGIMIYCVSRCRSSVSNYKYPYVRTSSYTDRAAPFMASAPQSKKPSKMHGVNVGGWLNIEDWFFCAPGVVQDVSGGNGGAQMPPFLSNTQYANMFGTDTFSSEGDITTKLVQSVGPALAVKYINTHRRSYYTESDFSQMRDFGISKIRVPFGWWIFSPISPDSNGLILDPYATGTNYLVAGDMKLMLWLLEMCKKYGITMMLDLHALPGGSSLGSYNGVSPLKPNFWEMYKQTYTSAPGTDLGLQTFKNVVKWYKSLPGHLKSVVSGIQPLNEPSHLMPQYNSLMYDWLTTAIAYYRSEFTSHLSDAPALYINLIQTAFPIQTQFMSIAHQWMSEWSKGVNPNKIYLDVHNYFAWAGGTMGDVMEFKTTDPYLFDTLQNNIPVYLDTFWTAMVGNGKLGYKLSSSEWSLAFNHISSACPTDEDIRVFMYLAQVDILSDDIELFFWTWKGPYSYTHINWWSLKDNVTILNTLGGNML